MNIVTFGSFSKFKKHLRCILNNGPGSKPVVIAILNFTRRTIKNAYHNDHSCTLYTMQICKHMFFKKVLLMRHLSVNSK